jgi:acyl-CoA synthetase (AMP-forming)/AMP-acid ligase II
MFTSRSLDRTGHPALVMASSGTSISHEELDARSNRLAHVFRAADLRRGDGVALLVENSPQFFDVVWAAHRAGLYYTPVSTRLLADEAAYIVDDSGAKALVASSRVPASAALVSALRHRPSLRLAVGDEIPGFDDYDAAVASQPDHPIADESVGRDMLYSSGTTGRPKGVRFPLPDGDVATAPIGTTRFAQALWSFDESTVYLSPAPLYHGAPLRFTMATMQLGGTVVVMEHFDPVAALAAIDRYDVTHSQWVPTMFVRLLRLPDEEKNAHDLSTHRFAIHAAAPCPVEVKRKMIDWWGPIVHEYYAATEGHGMTAISPTEWLERPGSVGRAVYGELHIVDDNGDEVAPGETGLVYFGGGQPFSYHNDPEKSRSSGDPRGRGWSTVGDVGHVDDDGYLYLADRQSFVIISGGVNIYPREIEDVLAMHPDVADVAVIGVRDPDLGEIVAAVVQLIDPGQANASTADALIEYARGRIAGFKCPRIVEFVDALPREPTGKLVKRLIELPSRHRR